MKTKRFRFKESNLDYLGGIAVVVLMVYFAPAFGRAGVWVGATMAVIGLFTIPFQLLAIWENISESIDQRRR